MSLPKIKILEKRKARLLVEYKTYVVRFEGFEVQEEGKYGPTNHYKFTIMNGKAEDGESSKGMPHTEMHGAEARIGSPHYKHLCELLLVKELDEDDEIDLTPRVGKYYNAVFDHKTDKKDRTKKYNQIKKLTKYVKKPRS